MASWLSQYPVLHYFGNLAVGAPALPQFEPFHPPPVVQPRLRNLQFDYSSQSRSIGSQAAKRAGSRPSARFWRKLPAMEPESSSPSLGSFHSKSEQSADDERMFLTGSNETCDNHTTGTEVFRFTDLPEEIRRLMYSYFLSIPPGEDFQLDQSFIDWTFTSVSAAILNVSREIYLEAFPIFLRENWFLIGSSLTNPKILRNFGPKRCTYLRSLSIQLNDRPVDDCIEILDELSQYCEDIRQLELRVSPGSHILPHLTSILVARTQAGSSSRTNVTFRVFVRKRNALPAAEQDTVDRAAEDIQLSFDSAFRWPLILQRAHEITIKGTIYKSSLDVLEDFEHEGWSFEKTSTTPLADCTTMEETVTRLWKPMVDPTFEEGA